MSDIRENSDYINCDLSVKKILQIYRQNNPSWWRPSPYARTAEGFLYFVHGGIHYDFDGFSFDAREGDVLRLPSGIPYSGYKLTDEDNDYYVIDFLTWEKDAFLRYPLPHAFRPQDQAGVYRAFQQLLSVWEKNEPCRLLDARASFLELLASLTRDYRASLYGTTHTERVDRICSYIREHSDESGLKTQNIADAFFISPTHLRRLFALQLKTSPVAYLNLIRMENARKLLLSNRDLSVSEVAEKSGYASVYYFSSLFKEMNGMTCSQYRSRYME